MSPSPDADWSWARDLLRRAVCAGGNVALRYWRRSPSQRLKADGSPVSEADLAVDAVLCEMLRAGAPEAAWLSEESSAPAQDRSRRLAWIVDPIDGTRPFLAGEPGFCIAAALTCEGAPVASAIFAPAQELLYCAALGQGAARNGAPMRASAQAELSGAVLACAKSLFPEAPPPLLRVNTAMCLALAEVAAGGIDALAARGRKSDWDLAAGALMVREAGGLATRLDGRAFAFNGADPRQEGVLAAGPALHGLLQARFADEEARRP